jgi:hypothetical protein
VGNRVVRFADRRAAFGFVAELRRLYDLERWAELWVYVTDDGILVDIPIRDPETEHLISLADRFGGWAPEDGADLALLRAAVDAEKAIRRQTATRLDETRPDLDQATGRSRRLGPATPQ